MKVLQSFFGGFYVRILYKCFSFSKVDLWKYIGFILP